MKSLPLFHQIAGKPVIVLGEGDMAEPKRRLVERARGKVITDLQAGVDEGARIAFVAHDDAAQCEADAIRLRCAGLLVNVVDRPDLCDFTTPSILDRDPVLVAVGTGGASAGLAKQLRLRLEQLLPADLGKLAEKLFAARSAIKQRFPEMRERRRALDAALGAGGALDPLRDHAADRIDDWLSSASEAAQPQVVEIKLASDDPDDLTMRHLRLLGSADVLVAPSDVPTAILNRARADAVRVTALAQVEPSHSLVVVLSY